MLKNQTYGFQVEVEKLTFCAEICYSLNFCYMEVISDKYLMKLHIYNKKYIAVLGTACLVSVSKNLTYSMRWRASLIIV